MKKTALTSTHIDLGAKMVEFAGYYMPLQYEGLGIEHETVRNAVGVFDVSHMGEFLLSGPNALELIQKVSSNDATKLTIGKAQYSCLPNDKGTSPNSAKLNPSFLDMFGLGNGAEEYAVLALELSTSTFRRISYRPISWKAMFGSVAGWFGALSDGWGIITLVLMLQLKKWLENK